MRIRSIFARSLLVFALAGGASVPALAQHVVTDNEAGKLTLDALTATPAPIVHRVAYRPLSRNSRYLPAAARARMSSRRAVRDVAWHRPVRSLTHRRARRG